MSDLDATTPRVFLARHGEHSSSPLSQLQPNATAILAHPARRLTLYLGETEWTMSGQQTGTSDIPLTSRGESQVLSSRRLLVGPGKLIDPSRVRKVWVSPRKRALKTFELLFNGAESTTSPNAEAADPIDQATGVHLSRGVPEEIFAGGPGSIVVTEQIAEWDYGDYEGLKKEQVRKLRFARGLLKGDEEWSVWRDGCEGGE
jgi:sedoheptulose-bisphosphatase